MTRSSHALIRRALAAVAAAMLIAAGMIPTTAMASEPDNMVLVWNENAFNVIHSAPAGSAGLGQAPPLSAASMAMVQGAVYDAVNAIDKGHQPYLPGLSAPSGASKAAAVAQAAHDVLVHLLLTPTPQPVIDRVDAMLNASLAQLTGVDPTAIADGRAIGSAAAAAMVAARANDGRFDVEPWTQGDAPGEWVPVAPVGNNVFGQFRSVVPFTLKSPSQFPTEGPPALTSPEYAAEFNEVMALGAQSGSSRTEAETRLAGFVGANPLGYMNKGLRDISSARGLTTTEQARLFAMTNIAASDALVACFNNKAHWSNWRPQTAIRAAATDGNDATEADGTWFSLFATPGYPDNASGYNCYTAGLWHAARLFFGTDKISFQLTSPGVPANPAAGNPIGVASSTRSYTRLTGVIDDTIYGRILTGFHFRSADVQGAWIGKKAAQWLDKHYFAPVD
jgi:hypothetical protein